MFRARRLGFILLDLLGLAALGFLYAVFVLVMIGSLILVAKSAPVPPPPKELTTELMAGRWEYDYGELRGGSITFNRDGTYEATHGPNFAKLMLGTWKIEDGFTLVLTEMQVCPQTRSVATSPYTIRYKFGRNSLTHLVREESTRVVLSNRLHP